MITVCNCLQTIFSVGDIICFDSPLAYSTNWISSDGGLVHVDSATGEWF